MADMLRFIRKSLLDCCIELWLWVVIYSYRHTHIYIYIVTYFTYIDTYVVIYEVHLPIPLKWQVGCRLHRYRTAQLLIDLSWGALLGGGSSCWGYIQLTILDYIIYVLV